MNQIPIAIINLKRSPDRRENMKKQLNALGLHYFIMDAVDGGKLSSDSLSKDIYEPSRAINCIKRELTLNEIGCSMSHLKVWEFLQNSSYQEILVLEDDALINQSLIDVLNNLDSFPKDWSLINLFSDQGEYKLLDYAIKGFKLKKFTRKMNRTAGYIINRSGIKCCIQQIYPIRIAIDGLFASLCQGEMMKCYGTEPQIITISDELFPSTIGQR